MPQIANIAVFHQPETHTLSIRLRSSLENLPMDIGQTYGQIMSYLAQLGETIADVPFVCYYNMDMQDLDVEIGFPVAKSLPAQGQIQSNIIPSQRAVVCIHQGAYSESAPVYDAMQRYMQDHALRSSSHVYEYYLNDPDRPESEFLTKIVMPIQE